LSLTVPGAQSSAEPPVRGLVHGAALARTYDAILDADFNEARARMSGLCAASPEWCAVMEAATLWWEISLDPRSRALDTRMTRTVEQAIARTEAWTTREPQRAEAWLARGAAYGARAQFRVERRERLGAARDGKHIKSALERALALDPAMHDAKFGIGMYRYYAAVAPAAFRFLRLLLLLPGGDRAGGLRQMIDARDHGVIVTGEADYQLHLIYLWYERRPHDALALIRSLAQRYPRNPLFPLVEARIHHVYFHDPKTSAIVLRALIARAEAGAINQPALAR
jgi:hypothetical protein